MGRLAGFSYQDVVRKLSKLGFEFKRQGKSSHETWSNPSKNLDVTIPKHRELREGTLREILKQANIDVEVFLNV